MPRPRLTALVESLPDFVPFVGPEAQERASGRAFRARLGANESPFGPSPKAIAVMEAAAAGNWMYSDPESYDLRSALARFHGVGIDNVVIGEGIDGLLGLSVRLAVEPGSAVVTSDGTYPTFNFHVAGGGGRLVRVPYEDDRQDLDADEGDAGPCIDDDALVEDPVYHFCQAGRVVDLLNSHRVPLSF